MVDGAVTVNKGAVLVERAGDVQLVADLMDAFVIAANQGWPANAMHSRLPSDLKLELDEYDRLLELAAADGLITTGIRGEAESNARFLMPLRITDVGGLYLDAWRERGGKDRRWGDAWSALLQSAQAKTPANMLGLLRNQRC